MLPHPLQILTDPVSICIIATYFTLILWETLSPGRQLPRVRYWKIRGILSFFFFFYLSTYLPYVWNEYFSKWQLFNLTWAGTFTGAVCGILLYEFGMYVWHRAMHRSDLLWKTFHQMHHSAERMDAYGAFYFSPLDMAGWTMLSSICLVLIVGLSPQAAMVTLLVTNFLGIFQHTNIKTPAWLGYFVQRPESHTIHHARGIHAYNYSDLPIFDILFGTFKNPGRYTHETGFYNGASSRIGEMLLFKDVVTPKAEKTQPATEMEVI